MPKGIFAWFATIGRGRGVGVGVGGGWVCRRRGFGARRVAVDDVALKRAGDAAVVLAVGVGEAPRVGFAGPDGADVLWAGEAGGCPPAGEVGGADNGGGAVDHGFDEGG